MTYRFDNEDTLVIYDGEAGNTIYFSVREIRDNLWEATIYSNDYDVNKVFTAPSKTHALMFSREVFNVDAGAEIDQLHDGTARVSVYYGEMNDHRPGVAIASEVGSGFHRAIVKVENWNA